ncbi:sulfide/dihydroorotate dehydrogenase-like FAD/NAD-binding protein [Clostridium guangxiense]|uniref:sulfide/dihydroorotate dehydrogenase-like FAD/NAD-binding protein n=1 Tax=Clostridium guangxiense TaxID=1662055 RepID=UPI001E3E97EE|nr:sulfide/dihydroorotate dehydrogenase-like FAD/NAD-binding protein [Clostridium guangxiense]MCD2348175.1 sulfide/dihydroorotate dehydrogenase-like FAD/NAD-binding protein [Clostridium guangxiense]
MHKIIKMLKAADDVYIMEFEASRIAKAFKPGQFVILRVHERGEKVPFSICDVDKEKGTVTIVFRKVGKTTEYMSKLESGQFILDATGPLGQPSQLLKIKNESKEKVLFISEDSASLRIYTELKCLHGNNVHADALLSFKNKDRLMFKEEISKIANKTYISFQDEDGEYNGNIDKVAKHILENEDYTLVVCMGSVKMMKEVCEVTKEKNIKTIVSLNVLMLDGTGMCGACRVNVGEEIKFACSDGPEFDGHLVDFDEVMIRQNIYSSFEAKKKYRAQHAGNEAAVEKEGC